MMLYRFFTIIVPIIILICSIDAHATSTEAKGLGAIVEGNVADARKNALEDAKRVAIEQMLGSYISARTETNNFMLASEKIYSTAKGQIDGYEILTEGKVDQETYFVTILARLDSATASTSAKQQLAKYSWYKQPKIIIQQQDSNGEHAANTLELFTNELSQSLRKIGFDVISDDASSVLPPTFIVSTSLTTRISNNEYQGLEIKSNQVSVAAKLLNAQTGQVLSNSTESKQAAGANSLAQFEKMVTKLAFRISQRINLDTKQLWLGDNTHSILLKLMSNNTEQIQLIESALNNVVVGLSSLDIQSKSAEKIIYLTKYQGWAEQLYEQLNSLSKDPSIPFTVSSFNGSEITLSIKH
jgi:hypothetical protein